MKMIAFLLALLALPVQAVTLTFVWQPVDDTRVEHYEFGRGTDPRPPNGNGTYGVERIDVPSTQTTTTITLSGPSAAPGGLWRFAVRACSENKTLCSDWSNEVEVDVHGPIPSPQGLQLQSMTFSAP
jgi:hypothetical protein